jgi:hypothetical protein
MMRSSSAILVLLGLLICCGLSSSPAGGQGAVKELLPAQATWTHRWDAILDGKLKDPKEADIEMSVRNNRITGKGAQDGRWTGEIVPGKVPVVMIRQDGPGFTVFSCGKLVKEGHIVGTSYSTKGGSGDFELVLKKK